MLWRVQSREFEVGGLGTTTVEGGKHAGELDGEPALAG